MYNPLTSFLQNLNKQFMPMPEDQINGNDQTNPTELDEGLFKKLERYALAYGAPIDIPHIVLETKISSKARKERN